MFTIAAARKVVGCSTQYIINAYCINIEQNHYLKEKFWRSKGFHKLDDTWLNVFIPAEHSLISKRYHIGWWFMYGVICLDQVHRKHVPGKNNSTIVYWSVQSPTYSPYAGHCFKNLKYINSFNPHKSL